jgi:hypothetical protein
MGLTNTAGSPEKLILFGAPYDVVTDCKPMSDLSGVTVEATATSGTPIFKRIKKPKRISGIDVKLSISEYNLLCQMIEAAPMSVPIGLVYPGLSMVSWTGQINMGEHDGSEGKATLELIFEDRPVVT